MAAGTGVAPADAGLLGLGGSAKPVLDSTQGPSDVTYHGTMTLNAPTSNGAYYPDLADPMNLDLSPPNPPYTTVAPSELIAGPEFGAPPSPEALTEPNW